MRFPKDKKDENAWIDFIIDELPDDPEYPASAKSAAAMQVIKMAHQITWSRDARKDQARQLTHMERRNLKLNQKITRLMKKTPHILRLRMARREIEMKENEFERLKSRIAELAQLNLKLTHSIPEDVREFITEKCLVGFYDPSRHKSDVEFIHCVKNSISYRWWRFYYSVTKTISEFVKLFGKKEDN